MHTIHAFSVSSRKKYQTKALVKSFAEKIGISPAIVVGRLQHEKLLPYTHMNDLRRRFVFK